MWIVTTLGMYSVVAAPEKNSVQVRSRKKADLEALIAFAQKKTAYGFNPRIINTPKRDYKFRIIVSTVMWADVMWRLASEAEQYKNFKDAVGKINPKRAQIYSHVWHELLAIEDEDKPAGPRGRRQWKPIPGDDRLD
jgi:hypothetical protein